MISGFPQFFPSPLEQSHIPGAVESIINDDIILFTPEYGYTNLEMKTPVATDKTIFRIITKQLLPTRINLRLIDIN